MTRWLIILAVSASAGLALLALLPGPPPDTAAPARPSSLSAPAPGADIASKQATGSSQQADGNAALAGAAAGPITEAEREQFAAQFAANPALIDLLEDADSPDPAVRADAERALAELSLEQIDPAQPRP